MSVDSCVTIRAGVSSVNKSLYHQIRFACHDPAILIEVGDRGLAARRILILRDVELARARLPVSQGGARADEIHAYQEFAPASGLSGERETAAAQAAAECLVRLGVGLVVADRSLPLIYSHYLCERGIRVACDPQLGILERRAKDAQEIEFLAKAQRMTEEAIAQACEMIARAPARSDGVLLDHTLGKNSLEPLTSERVKSQIDVFLMQRGFTSTGCIVAGGAQASDCHHSGAGELRTLEPIIVDVFPCDTKTLYHGDCTRTVVHLPPGESRVPEAIERMHAAVLEAKSAAISALRPGVLGDAVHRAAVERIVSHGYSVGFEAIRTTGSLPHGTGHGLGLDLKEPPLLDFNGPVLIEGDAVTVEPALYQASLGGLRLEDLLIVTRSGSMNLNSLHQGLVWN